ncbi:hypothetical protein OHB56_40240 [Streptomyces sp. NBC_01635]|uniref:hypothetical protein n=1 Tax=Streptomyces sp. NBC_01635 TaxID=2975904 RepID=UPI00386E7AD8|nr:hypothetical protein OHB56_00670 [Streptomyces sp. NBC_01635]WTD79491.1 hypothetical protein OHB56_40240 [Streptomyces sp. NBC_01635]
MCGACGAGRSVPRWEDILAPPTRSVLAARAASTDRLLDGGCGLRVRSWLSAGYLLSDRVGRTTHAADLDTLWRAAGERGARPKDWRPLRGAETTVSVEAPGGWDLATAAVWFAAVARSQPDTSLEITLPDPGGARTLLVTIDSGAVGAVVVTDFGDGPPPEATAVVSGAGAVVAARHLEKFGGRRPRRRA